MPVDTTAEQIVNKAAENNNPQEPEVNLEELFNPNQNLTPREQAYLQRMQQLEQAAQAANQRLNYEQQAKLVEQIRRLPPQQQQVAVFLYQLAYALDQEKKKNESMTEYYRRMEEAVMPLVKDKIVTETSTKTGIEKGIIEKYGSDPKTAKAVAAAVYEFKKSKAFEERKATGVDNTPSGDQQSVPTDKDSSELKKKFYGSGKIADYLRAMRDAK